MQAVFLSSPRPLPHFFTLLTWRVSSSDFTRGCLSNTQKNDTNKLAATQANVRVAMEMLR